MTPHLQRGISLAAMALSGENGQTLNDATEDQRGEGRGESYAETTEGANWERDYVDGFATVWQAVRTL